MHRAEFGSAVSPIMTMPHFALILEITPLNYTIKMGFLPYLTGLNPWTVNADQDVLK